MMHASQISALNTIFQEIIFPKERVGSLNDDPYIDSFPRGFCFTWPLSAWVGKLIWIPPTSTMPCSSSIFKILEKLQKDDKLLSLSFSLYLISKRFVGLRERLIMNDGCVCFFLFIVHHFFTVENAWLNTHTEGCGNDVELLSCMQLGNLCGLCPESSLSFL